MKTKQAIFITGSLLGGILLMVAALVFLSPQAVSASPLSQAAAVPVAVNASLPVIDDFQSGGVGAWFTYGDAGSSIVKSVVLTNTISTMGVVSNTVMKVNYVSAGWGVGTGKDTVPFQDWSAYDGLSFWFRGTNSGTVFTIILTDNAGERLATKFTDNSSGWRELSFPWQVFYHDTGFQPGGAPNDGPTLTAVEAYAFAPTSPSSGTYFMDQVKLFKNTGTVVDSFQSGGVGAWFTYGDAGSSIVKSVVLTNTISTMGVVSNTVMKVNYVSAGWGVGTGKDTVPFQDWSAYDGLSFWFRGTNSGTVFTIILTDNAGERLATKFTDNSSGWRELSFPWQVFYHDTGFQPGGAPNDGPTLTAVEAYAFAPTSPSSGTYFMDQVKLFKNTGTVVDSFQSGGVGAWFTYGDAGSSIVKSVVLTNTISTMGVVSNTVMKVNYVSAGWGVGTGKDTVPFQDWSAYDGLSFWFRGTNSGTVFTIILTDNAGERLATKFTDNSSGWRELSFPWQVFYHDTGFQPGGAPNDGPTLTAVEAYAFAPTSPSSGTYFMDQVKLYTNNAATAPKAQFSSSNYNVVEGSTAVVTVTLTAPAAYTATVDYVTLNGTASGADYTAVSGTLNILPGMTALTFTVTTLEDVIPEPNETIVLSLTNPVTATIGTINPATLTIVDNEPRLTFKSANYTVIENAGPAVITVSLTSPAVSTITVNYSTTAGTATAITDYTTATGTLTFTTGVSEQSFIVPIIDDTNYELNETVVLNLSNPTNALIVGINPATLTINDNEVPPDIRLVDDYESGAPYRRNLLGNELGFAPWGDSPASMPVVTTTVVANSDPLARPGQGTSNALLKVTYNIGSWGGFTHVLEDGNDWTSQDWSRYDGVRFWYYGANTGGTIQFEIHDNRALYSTGDSAERWYYRFADNSTGWRLIIIPFTAFQRRTDWQPGGAPNDGFNLRDVSAYSFGLPNGVGSRTIYLDQFELFGDLSLHPKQLRAEFLAYSYAVSEGNTAAIRVMLNESDTLTTTVGYTITAGTATAGVDYSGVAVITGQLTFAPGTTIQTISIPTLEDSRVEANETLDLALSNPTNASIGWKSVSRLYIYDEDVPDPNLIDDFENGVPVGLILSNGVTVTAMQVPSSSPLAVPGQYPINTILNVTYTLPTAPGGFIRTFPTAQDWSGHDGYSFWFYGKNTGANVKADIHDNRAPDPGPSGWTLAWSDEFTGANGSPVNDDNWTHEIGGQGWGNNEREYYTDSTENSSVDGSGNLVITAKTEPVTTTLQCHYGKCEYTSARLVTANKFEFAYGRAEARIKIPYGQGIWPAFWTLGNDIGTAGWPTCGEIDILENIGNTADQMNAHGTIHGPGYSGGSGIGTSYNTGVTLHNDFHVFAIEWEPTEIRWYIDGYQYFTATTSSIPTGTDWVFDHPFFLIMNVAVGGYWPGYPDATTTFPQMMTVDYVRVYQAPKNAERYEALFSDNFSGWKKVTLPFSAFNRGADQPVGAPNDGLDLTEVWGYGFGMPAGTNNNFYLDDVALITGTTSLPSVQFANSAYSVAEGSTVTVTASLDVSSSTPVTVTYTTANGTAIAGSDYLTKTGTLVFAPGEMSKTFQVVILKDALKEIAETFTVNLSDPKGAILGTIHQATLTIRDYTYVLYMPLIHKP